jgi:hypothetical protein
MIEMRIDEQHDTPNVIQNDPVSGASLCEVHFSTKKALFLIRPNGSASTINGKRLVLAGGLRRPKSNPSLSTFLTSI